MRALAAVLLLVPLAVAASEIPPSQEPAVASAPCAEGLDRVEAAERLRSDPEQKGGDAGIALAILAAAVILFWLALENR